MDLALKNGLRLYPNPTNSVLNIELNTVLTEGKVEVFDVLGKEVFTQKLQPNNSTQIDVSNWDTGMYLLKISSENGEATKRFVKQ